MRPINLLPPEQAERAKRRRGLMFGLFLGVLFLFLLAAITFWRLGQAGDAEQAVVDQQLENQQVLGQIAALSEAEELRRRYDSTAEQIQEVLTIDIEWGSLLNDVGRVIPDRVWLDGLSVTRQVPDEAAEGIDATTFGSISMTGQAFDYPDSVDLVEDTRLCRMGRGRWRLGAFGFARCNRRGPNGHVLVLQPAHRCVAVGSSTTASSGGGRMRRGLILGVLIGIVIAAAWWFLVNAPIGERILAAEENLQVELDQITVLRSRIQHAREDRRSNDRVSRCGRRHGGFSASQPADGCAHLRAQPAR